MKKIKTLFMVDDDEIFMFLTQKAVEQTHLVDQIKIFPNGSVAYNFLKSEAGRPENLPEIILLDLSMPVMDGWEFLEKYIQLLPKLKRKITIYIMSSSIAPADVEKAKSISAVTDYIIKPVTKDKLTNLLTNYLAA
jgi:CheY-like chemotaxis protein